MSTKKTGLELLREPFPAHQISKLPKETKAQSDERKQNMACGVKCQICGGWHHKNAVHLDYVGHAALTDRLLDADQNWSWEPMAFRDGLPAFDGTGGLWIKLVVCGVSRLGYGHAAAKQNMDPGAREKEVIGDALRNAAMRFGAALDLWHKGDLHVDADEAEQKPNQQPQKVQSVKILPTDGAWDAMSPEEQSFLTDISMEVVRLITTVSADEAHKYLENQKLDGDEKVALWTRLDSKTRSALKRAHEAAKVAA